MSGRLPLDCFFASVLTGSKELLDGLLAYSQRHSARLDRLLRATFLLDYTLAASQVLLPDDMQQQQHMPAAAAAAEEPKGITETAGNGVSGALKMNGTLHHTKGSSSESEDQQDVDVQHQLLQQVQQPQFGKGGSRVLAGSSGKRQQPEPDEEYLDDGKQLPGWGGGDDLEDDWDLGGEEDGSQDGEEDPSEDVGGDEQIEQDSDSDEEEEAAATKGGKQSLPAGDPSTSIADEDSDEGGGAAELTVGTRSKAAARRTKQQLPSARATRQLRQQQQQQRSSSQQQQSSPQPALKEATAGARQTTSIQKRRKN